MASRAIDDGLTLAPFRRIYGSERDVALLANTYFSTDDWGIPHRGDPDGPSEPTIVAMPNRVQFEATLARWLQDTAFDSLPDDMKEHESFSDLVQAGSRNVPLIAASLRRSPSFLFLALEEIFNENPVPEKAQGNLRATVASWLQWLQR